jgi:hypothetical protein
VNSIRMIDYHFRLANRQSVLMRAQSLTLGATTIPLKFRFGGEKGATVTDDANVNLYMGLTRSALRYTHLEHASAEENPVRVVRSMTFAASFGMSSAELDSTRKVGVVSPGLAVLMRARWTTPSGVEPARGSTITASGSGSASGSNSSS